MRGGGEEGGALATLLVRGGTDEQVVLTEKNASPKEAQSSEAWARMTWQQGDQGSSLSLSLWLWCSVSPLPPPAPGMGWALSDCGPGHRSYPPPFRLGMLRWRFYCQAADGTAPPNLAVERNAGIVGVSGCRDRVAQ